MDAVVVENNVFESPWHSSILHAAQPEKKSFEEAVVECDGRPVSEFFDELRRQVKDYFKNA